MIYFLYNVLLLILVIITSPFLLYKVLTKEKHRKGFWEKVGIAGEDPSPSGRGAVPVLRDIEGVRVGSADAVCVHVHAVSVGEVIAATPFIKGLRQRHPDIRLTLSTVTPTGNDLARLRLPEVDRIMYSPFDLPWSVKRFINRVRPDIYISVETELWPNFLREVKRSGAKSIIINGRISPDAFKGYKRFRLFMKKVLSNVDLFCMQSEEDARRIREIGAAAGSVTVTGNMKYDQKFIEMDEDAMGAKMRLYGIEKGDKVIVAGSTHPGENEVILTAYLECLKDNEKLRLIIVPRHIERSADIEKLVKAKGLDVIRRTGLSNSEKNCVPCRTVIVVDTIGELSTLYSIATVVIMGGSFIPHGGQNPLEAMFYKKPVIFGRYMFNFKQITEEILQGGAGLMVEDEERLREALRGVLNDSRRQWEMGEKGYKIITRNRGAVERNIAIIEKILSAC